MEINNENNERKIEYLINENGAIVIIIRNWLSNSFELCKKLQDKIPWRQDSIVRPTKTYKIPRRIFFAGDENVNNYTYDKMSFPVENWFNNENYSDIEEIRTMIEKDETITEIVGLNLRYDSCLLNEYATGKNSIGFHSDKEALGPKNAVVTVSLGGTRSFQFRSKDFNRKEIIETNLYSGDLVLMAGTCQELFTHSIPKVSKASYRISLTYRTTLDTI